MTQTTTTTVSLGGGSPDELGAAASDLVGMHGVRSIQVTAATSVSTSAAIAVSVGYGFATQAQADAIVAGVNACIAALKAKGLMAA